MQNTMSRDVGGGKRSWPATLPSISKWRRHWISLEIRRWVGERERERSGIGSLDWWVTAWAVGWMVDWPTSLLTDWLTRWLTRWLLMSQVSHGWFSELHWSISSRESPSWGYLPRLSFWPVFIGIRFAENIYKLSASSGIVQNYNSNSSMLQLNSSLFKQSRC